MQDLLGQALSDYYNYDRDHTLWVHDTLGPKVDMPVSVYFRPEKDMPELELEALRHCKGHVLDIGAGAGSHALVLQDRDIQVTALDISPLAADVMRLRGVDDVMNRDIFQLNDQRYDTLLLMMNGIGLCSNIQGLHRFLKYAKNLLAPGGQLLFDSSDVAYLYEDEVPATAHYYGEIRCRYEYKKQKTDWFSWLYVDRETLASVALQEGYTTEILFEDNDDQYLARLTAVL